MARKTAKKGTTAAPRSRKDGTTAATKRATTRKRTGTGSAPPPNAARPTTLAVDVGGTHIKTSVLDRSGAMLHERLRVDTPRDLTPQGLVDLIADVVRDLPTFDRVSVGFPGVVRDGVIRTAPNLGTERFRGFDLGDALSRRLDRPVRVCNDADVQGFAAIHGKGVEMVITLGTGFGTALFDNGRLAPHLELAHHCFRKGKTYEDELGERARKRDGSRRWNRAIARAIETLRELTAFDHLYIGGGNAHRLDLELPEDVSVVDNTAGILGGIRLWEG